MAKRADGHCSLLPRTPYPLCNLRPQLLEPMPGHAAACLGMRDPAIRHGATRNTRFPAQRQHCLPPTLERRRLGSGRREKGVPCVPCSFLSVPLRSY
eukprot:6768155-Alexandrium_andersonii.AAC.1